MKKFLPITLAALTLGLAATLAVPTLAKPGAHAAKASGARMQKLAASLGLTEAQKAQMKPIVQGSQQQAKAIKADTSLTPQAKQAKMKDLRKSTTKQTMAILTPDQREKLKAMREQRQAAKGKA